MLMKHREDVALFIIRVAIGAIFIAHGSQKVLGLFGGPGMTGFIQWIAPYGVSPLIAQIGAYAELIGGILLLTGIAAELGAVLALGVMAGAVKLIHWPHGFFIQNGGFEYTLLLAVLCFAIIVGGPGRWAAWDRCEVTKK